MEVHRFSCIFRENNELVGILSKGEEDNTDAILVPITKGIARWYKDKNTT
ncbi:hypothetical protein [Staphylococcus ursi]|nr:hypothetical protein [Staphylococcus sp. MI 10-1553]